MMMPSIGAVMTVCSRLTTAVFSCDFGVYDTAKSATGYTLAVRG